MVGDNADRGATFVFAAYRNIRLSTRLLAGLGELKASSLERLEKLEQLRFLQNGHKIVVGTIEKSHRGIDTRADYDAFKSRWFEKYGRNPTN